MYTKTEYALGVQQLWIENILLWIALDKWVWSSKQSKHIWNTILKCIYTHNDIANFLIWLDRISLSPVCHDSLRLYKCKCSFTPNLVAAEHLLDIYVTYDNSHWYQKLQAFGSYGLYKAGNQHPNLQVPGHFELWPIRPMTISAHEVH